MTARFCLATALLAIAGLATPGPAAEPSDPNGPGETLQSLLSQRRDALQTRLKYVQQMRANGTRTLEQVILARNALYEAELELAPSQEKRRELCQRLVENLRELEVLTRQRHEIGESSVEDHLLAMAARLQAEINCLRASAAESTPVASSAAKLPRPLDAPSTADAVSPGFRPQEFDEDAWLRRATELRTTLTTLVASVSTNEALLKTDLSRDDREGVARRLETARQHLLFHRDEWAARLRLLELDFRNATASFKAAQQSAERARRLVEAAATPPTALLLAERAAAAAESRVARSQTLLELYREIGAAGRSETRAP